jgi:hypothetical protein
MVVAAFATANAEPKTIGARRSERLYIADETLTAVIDRRYRKQISNFSPLRPN